MIKVLTIINNLGIGGIEKTLLSCIPHLKSQNIAISILCVERKGDLTRAFSDNCSEIFVFEKKGNPIHNAIQLFNLLRRTKFDIVHSRFGHSSGLFSLVCFLVRKPFIVSIHSEKYLSNKKRKIPFVFDSYLWIHKFMTKLFSTKIIGHSRTNLLRFDKNWENSQKYSLLYNGIDFEKLRGNEAIKRDLMHFIKPNDLVFIHIGSFREPKNHSFLIKVFSKLLPQENNYKLILLGDGELFLKIKLLVRDLGLNENVFFVGSDHNISNYLALSNILIFPSLQEGLGNVLLEAQFFKVPICASKIPAHFESSYRFYHQFFFDPTNIGDAENKIQETIKLFKKNKLYIVLNEAHEFVKQGFSVEKMALSLSTLYNETLKQNKIG